MSFFIRKPRKAISTGDVLPVVRYIVQAGCSKSCRLNKRYCSKRADKSEFVEERLGIEQRCHLRTSPLSWCGNLHRNPSSPSSYRPFFCTVFRTSSMRGGTSIRGIATPGKQTGSQWPGIRYRAGNSYSPRYQCALLLPPLPHKCGGKAVYRIGMTGRLRSIPMPSCWCLSSNSF